jgi:hypothetical protein
MTIEELRKHHRSEPFVPFRIHMANGRSLDVVHPELLSFSGSGRVAYVSTPDDAHESVDLLLISSLELIAKKAHRRRNGRG